MDLKTFLEKWLPTIISGIISLVLSVIGITSAFVSIVVLVISLPISLLIDVYFFEPRRKKANIKDIIQDLANTFERSMWVSEETSAFNNKFCLPDKQELSETYMSLLLCKLRYIALCAENSKIVGDLVNDFKNLNDFLNLYRKYIRSISSSGLKLGEVINALNSLADSFEAEAKKVEKIVGKKLNVHASEYKIN